MLPFVYAAAVSALSAGKARADALAGEADITIVEGTGNDGAALKEVLEELLTRGVSVQPHFTSAPRLDVIALFHPNPSSAYRPVARVFIDLATSSEEALVYVTDGDSEQVLLRAIPRGASSEVMRETVGQVVEMAVDALVHGDRIGITRADAERLLVRKPPPASAPSSPRPHAASPQPVRTPRLFMGLLYGGQTFATNHLVAHGPVASVELTWPRTPLSFGPWLLLQVRFPMFTQSREFGLHLESACARLLFSMEYRDFRIGLGPGVELFRLIPTLTDGTPSTAAPIDAFAVPIASAAFSYQLRLPFGMAALAAITLDGDFSETHFVVRQGGAHDSILSPWPLRAGLMAGIVTR